MYLIRNTSDKDIMNKKEFMDILRQSLIGEVNDSVIEQSINFYNEYISSQSDKSEEEVIDEIGNPRLIAKTIIESEKASYGETENREKYSNRSYHNDYTRENDYRSSLNKNKVYHLKWYHLLIIAIIILFLFSFLIRIGWILLKLLFVFFVPIVFVLLLLVMFRKR